MNGSRIEVINEIKASQSAGKYNEMLDLFYSIDLSQAMNKEEHNLFSIAATGIIQSFIDKWSAASSAEVKSEGELGIQQQHASERTKIETDVRTTLTNKLLPVINEQLKLSKETYHSILFSTLLADAYSLLARVATDETKSEVTECAILNYESALDKSKESLPPYDPYRLNVGLNLSVFYQEVNNSTDRATSLAKQTFDESNDNIENMKGDRSHSEYLMGRLNEKLREWTSNQQADEN